MGSNYSSSADYAVEVKDNKALDFNAQHNIVSIPRMSHHCIFATTMNNRLTICRTFKPTLKLSSLGVDRRTRAYSLRR